MNTKKITWPKKDGIKKIVLTRTEKLIERFPQNTLEITDPRMIEDFFDALYELNPNGGGMMKDFGSDISRTMILFTYDDGTMQSCAIYGDIYMQSMDTSFYVSQTDQEKSTRFCTYVHGFFPSRWQKIISYFKKK